ncbi:MAG: [protein-PII] uridylyltransferase [Candidatus Acidiferrales bacterium]
MAAPDSVRELQEYYSEGFARIQKKFEVEGDGWAAISEGSALVDELISRLYRNFFSEAITGPAGTCVVALGGYGRRTLFPHSDVDLLFLHEDAASAGQMKEPTAQFCRTLWDLRLRLGQNTRVLSEIGQFDPDNAEFSVALLDARLLAGDARLYAKMHDAVVPKAVARERRDLIAGLEDLTEKRHAKFGRTIFHLEPNIKEVPGGIRDYDVSRWLVIISALEKRKEWVQPEEEWPASLAGKAKEAYRFLCAVRCFLHYRRGRDDNTLSYEFQDEAAGIGLGLETREAVPPADWMRFYFRHVRAIDRLSTQLLDEIPPAPSYLYDYYEDWRSRRSNADFWVRRERIFLRNPAMLDQPEALLAPFEFIARHGFRLSGEAEEQIEEAVARVGARAGELPDLWDRLKRILTSPHAADALRAMRRVRLLRHLIPEFRVIDSLVIRDFYHRYTVDEHTFMTIENVQRLLQPQQDWERGFHDILVTLERPDLLFLSLLLHDVGKGLPVDDHVVGSLQVVEEAAARFKLDPEEEATVRFLVGSHLEMSSTMQRRDVFDPATVRIFAEKMGSPERLKMLCLLTYTDIRSVNPEALTPWKAGTLWHLYVRSANYLVDSVDENRIHAAGEQRIQIERILPFLGDAADSKAFASFLEGFPLRYLASHSPDQVAEHFRMAQRLNGDRVEVRLGRRLPAQGGNQLFEMTLLTDDRPFLFATIAGTLFAWGMNVIKADAFASQAGIVLDTFEFVDLHGTLELNPSEEERFKGSLRDVLSARASLESILARRSQPPAGAGAKVAVRTQLRFDDEASTHSTLLELVAQDRPGLLYRISKVLAETNCNIEVALVDTEGPKAIDVFYLTVSGKKLDAARQEALRNALTSALG